MNIYLKSLSDTDLRHSISEFATIGTDSSCQLILQDSSVAERHARIEKKESALWIRDLRSQNGTFVNDVLIFEAQFALGDVLRFGEDEWLVSTDTPIQLEFPLNSRNEVWNAELQSLGPISETDFPVLILGPSGTGKDIIAQAIHASSSRAKFPLINVNCSALTETLVESELFGHIKGSFTGAISDRKGAFEAARGGTLFLDEIGDLTYSLQAKLLRALENNEIRPVGSDRSIRTDIRIIAATHQNLTQKIRDGQFRSDLYYRLNVMSVTPPALAHRMEDFDDLIYSFAKKLRVRFSFLAIQRLKKHSWPGNIRELKNLVARASALYKGQLIEEPQVERLIDKTLSQEEMPMARIPQGADPETLPVIKEIEKHMILQRLQANRGNQRRTAQDLGMPKSTLHDRLKYYSIDVENFKV